MPPYKKTARLKITRIPAIKISILFRSLKVFVMPYLFSPAATCRVLFAIIQYILRDMKKESESHAAKEKIICKPAVSTVIVLAIAAAVLLFTVFSIYSGDALKGDTSIFSVYGGEQVEFEKASVTEILSESMEADDAADGAYEGSQELSVVVGSGRYKGEGMGVDRYFGPRSGVLVSK